MSQQPAKVLEANGGLETMAVSQLLHGVADDPIWIACTWFDQNTGYRFGVKMEQYLQEFSIGKAPTWSYMQDHTNKVDSKPRWHKINDTSKVHKWHGADYSIVARPEAHHTSLTVKVIISKENDNG